MDKVKAETCQFKDICPGDICKHCDCRACTEVCTWEGISCAADS